MEIDERTKNLILKNSKSPNNIRDIIYKRQEGTSKYYECIFKEPVKTPVGQVFKSSIMCVREDDSVVIIPR